MHNNPMKLQIFSFHEDLTTFRMHTVDREIWKKIKIKKFCTEELLDQNILFYFTISNFFYIIYLDDVTRQLGKYEWCDHMIRRGQPTNI